MQRFISVFIQKGSSGFILVNLFGMRSLDMVTIWSVIFLACMFMSGSNKMFQFVFEK